MDPEQHYPRNTTRSRNQIHSFEYLIEEENKTEFLWQLRFFVQRAFLFRSCPLHQSRENLVWWLEVSWSAWRIICRRSNHPPPMTMSHSRSLHQHHPLILIHRSSMNPCEQRSLPQAYGPIDWRATSSLTRVASLWPVYFSHWHAWFFNTSWELVIMHLVKLIS